MVERRIGDGIRSASQANFAVRDLADYTVSYCPVIAM